MLVRAEEEMNSEASGSISLADPLPPDVDLAIIIAELDILAAFFANWDKHETDVTRKYEAGEIQIDEIEAYLLAIPYEERLGSVQPVIRSSVRSVYYAGREAELRRVSRVKSWRRVLVLARPRMRVRSRRTTRRHAKRPGAKSAARAPGDADGDPDPPAVDFRFGHERAPRHGDAGASLSSRCRVRYRQEHPPIIQQAAA